jgi:HD-like signal output (HDOD) protein/GAF domain-containing protein
MTSTAQRRDDERFTPLEAVLARLRDSEGFPTLSTTISDINSSVASESHSARQLTQVILRDVALTTKLLQVVNSAIYGQYRGRIRTVSKAVLILGFDAVRNTAMSLMMLEFARGHAQEKTLQDELIGAFFAGVISKPLCQRLGIANSEEAVICTMFQSLGRLLAVFFLYEESQQISALIADGISEEQAAERVLGISYRELGMGVARHWNFPERLLAGMQPFDARDIPAPKTDLERLKIAANLANDLYVTALRSSQSNRTAALESLRRRYGAAIKVDLKELTAVVDAGLKEIAERAMTLNLPVAHSPTLDVIRVWNGGASQEKASAQPSHAASVDPLMQHVEALDAVENEDETSIDPQQILSAGIRDITETLTSEFALNDVLQMVLETMYRALGFTRTMVFVRDMRTNTMRARLGFGADIERIIPQCSFPLAFAPDVFHVALEKSADIAIENTQAANIVERIPEWHRQLMSAKSFLLLPVTLKNHVIGLLYADYEGPETLKISPEQLGLLRTLRSQVVLAFKHSAASAHA